jgi:hypothetical protein
MNEWGVLVYMADGSNKFYSFTKEHEAKEMYDHCRAVDTRMYKCIRLIRTLATDLGLAD